MTKEERYEHAYFMLLHWIDALNMGYRITDYFEDEDITTIAIYGMGELADRLVNGLKDSKIKIIYGIDRDPACSVGDISEIYNTEEKEYPEVDAVIIMPFYDYDNIEKMLRSKVKTCRFISIEEIIWSL